MKINDLDLLFDIAEEVTGMDKEEIMTGGRKPKYVDIKKIIAISLRQNTDWSLAKIGESLNTDHSNISYYLSLHESLMETCERFKEAFLKINVKYVSVRGNPPVEMKLKLALEERRILNKNINKYRRTLAIKKSWEEN